MGYRKRYRPSLGPERERATLAARDYAEATGAFGVELGLVVPPGQCNFDVTINGTSIAMAPDLEDCANGKLVLGVPSGIVGPDGSPDIGLVRSAPTSIESKPIIIRTFSIQTL